MEFLKPLYDEELNSECDVKIVGSVFARSRTLGPIRTADLQLDLCRMG